MKSKTELACFHEGMGDSDSLVGCLVAIDTIMKTSPVNPRCSFKLTRKNNFLVIESIWFNGKPADQHRLRSSEGAVQNLSWLMRTVESVAVAHDLIPIILDRGFCADLIGVCSNRNIDRGATFFHYTRIPKHYESEKEKLSHLLSVPDQHFFAPKEIIFEWLNTSHSQSLQRKVLLPNKRSNDKRL